MVSTKRYVLGVNQFRPSFVHSNYTKNPINLLPPNNQIVDNIDETQNPNDLFLDKTFDDLTQIEYDLLETPDQMVVDESLNTNNQDIITNVDIQRSYVYGLEEIPKEKKFKAHLRIKN